MAAPIITCPACTKKFKGKEGLAGKRIKCPLCATPFVVPGDGAQQIKAGAPKAAPAEAKKAELDDLPIKLQDETEAPPSAAMAQQRVTWNPEDENRDPYAMGDFDLRARCPNCANLMESEEAVICVFCGYNTQTREWGKTVRTISITGGQHFLHLLPGIIFLLMAMIFIFGLLFYCLELPPLVANTWASFFDHESLRMWIIGLVLGFTWAFGTLAYRRLIVNPKPSEKEKQTEEE